MAQEEGGIFYNLENLIRQDYRGVNVCIRLETYRINIDILYNLFLISDRCICSRNSWFGGIYT